MTEVLFRLTGICFSYGNEPPVLSNAAFELKRGERVALVGSNGAGKTTLLHLMVGLLRPQAGTIEAFGAVRRSERDFHEVRVRAGLLFQNAEDQLFCPTVAEDVAFGPLNLGKSRAEAEEIARKSLAALGLDGLATRVTHKLSGGQRRLVSLAAVLAMEPEVLLLDEATTALDRLATERLIEILLGLPQALVVISHDENFLRRLTQRQVYLENGCFSEFLLPHP
ncbi:MAG: ABC transporter ATP-binding protein [Rhodospirillaceae bacterium]